MRTEWSDADFALAMERAVLAHADVTKRNAGRVRFNAWWRGGDAANVSLNLTSGVWRDFVTGEKGGARQFALVAFGLPLVEFMRAFGSDLGSAGDPLSVKRREATREQVDTSRKDVLPIWAALSSGDVAPASAWLRTRRGFPGNVESVVDSGYGCLIEPPDNLPWDIRRWAEKIVSEFGPFIVVPLRCTKTGNVESLHFRPMSATKDGRRFLPNTRTVTPDRFVRVYGLPRGGLVAKRLFICEGAVDTMLVESFVSGRPSISVVGSPSASVTPTLVEWLRAKVRGDVVLVPQQDEVGIASFARLESDLTGIGIPVSTMRWGDFTAAAGVDAAKDVGDVAVSVGWEATRAAFATACGLDP